MRELSWWAKSNAVASSVVVGCEIPQRSSQSRTYNNSFDVLHVLDVTSSLLRFEQGLLLLLLLLVLVVVNIYQTGTSWAVCRTVAAGFYIYC